MANPLPTLAPYDFVLLGSPIWNVRPPMIMHTFAESHDFTGKMVYPFTTHAMSGLGSTVSRYEAACRGATVGVGLAVQGESVATDGPTAVGPWLAGMSLGPG
jgi:flavodoxin